LRLPIAEVHILAKTDIRSLEDLGGRKVNFGPAGSGSSLTGTIVFQRLGVQVDQVLIDQQSAVQKLQSGEVAALVRVVGKPVDFFTRIPPNSGLHLISIPFTETFADYYTVGEFETKDYPSLVADGQTIDTIAVPAVLAVFNWPRGSATGALNALPNGSSQTGTNSWLRPVIQSGGTSTWAPRFRVRRGTLSPSSCLSVSTVLRYQRKGTSVAIFRPSKIASEPVHHH